MGVLSKVIHIVFFLLFSCMGCAQDSIVGSEWIPLQQQIIAKLTGERPLKNEIYLAQRASPRERDLTVEYLSQYLKGIHWQLENHRYKATNGNPFLDLLMGPMKGVNVAAVLPATIPSEEYVLFGAHYDSERDCPGAIDNASGVALCLAIANKLTLLKERKVNFLIVLFDQEEDNEVGSGAYVKLLKNTKRKIHSAHIFDLIGWDNDGDKAITLQSPAPFLEELYTKTADESRIPFEVVGGGASDNRQFTAAGFHTIAVFEEEGDSTPHLHKPTDTYATVNFEYLASCTQFIHHIFKQLAQ
ncbi:M28 family metallopeptidase [Spongiimicrobium salis]|uniref:M28 family metallopeptidase n=1 Tax=Spongiimicrobium salis TaxID=1667022 RepID=UPI00374C8B3B